jgi:hypothetical protein
MFQSLQSWNPNSSLRRQRQQSSQPWVHNFHLMCSKDNNHYPKYLREYFDTPRNYDVNGSRKQVFIATS